MTTQKQIAANRRNARKSTGPRTDEGKAASSGNALKHGVLSTKAVSEREDREAYQKLLEKLEDEFEPGSAYESILAERLAILFWCERRLAEAEASEITRTHVRTDMEQAGFAGMAMRCDLDVGLGFSFSPCRELSFSEQLLIGRYQGMLGRQIRETLQELRNEQDRRMLTIDQVGEPSWGEAGKPASAVPQRSRPH